MFVSKINLNFTQEVETEQIEKPEINDSESTEPKGDKSKNEKKVEPITKVNRLTLKKGEEEMQIGFGKLICGPEYNTAILKVMGQELKVLSERTMQTLHMVLKCSLSIESEAVPCTLIYPEGDEVVRNQNVIRVNVLSWNSKSTPVDFVYVNVSFEKWENMDLDVIKTEIIKDVAKLVKRELTPQYHFLNQRVYR
jgi:hypothetical protein